MVESAAQHIEENAHAFTQQQREQAAAMLASLRTPLGGQACAVRPAGSVGWGIA